MWFLALCALAPVVVSSADCTLGVEGGLHCSVGTVFQAVNTDGSLKWTFDAVLPIVTHQEGLDGTIHIFAQSTTQIEGKQRGEGIYYMLRGSDGAVHWQYASHAAGLCLPHSVDLLISSINAYLVCEILQDFGHGRFISQVQIQAIDVVAGTWKWSEFGQGGAPNLVKVGPDGGVLAQSGVVSDSLSSFHPENGTTKWTANMDLLEPRGGWVLSEGDIFIASAEDWRKAHLVYLNGEDGSSRWNASYELREGPHGLEGPSVMPISGCNGEVFVPNLKDEDGHCSIHAFDFNGNVLRTLPCFFSFSFHQHSIRQNEDGSEEDIFVTSKNEEGDQRTTIAAYSGTTGYLLWNASIAGRYGNYGTEFSFGLDGTVVVFDATQEQVVAIHNGKEAWRVPLENVWEALIAKDGTTYLMHGVEVVAVDMNGTQKWSYHFPDLTVGSAANSQASFAVV